MRRLLHAAGIIFKGSGFYKTDSRRDAPSKPSGSSSTPADGDAASKPAAEASVKAPESTTGTTPTADPT